MNRYVVSKERIAHNVEQVRTRLGDKILIAVVKGNGYGLGLLPYSEYLSTLGVTHFAVTEPEDAAALRAALPEAKILMLRSTALEEELSVLIQNRITLTVGSPLALSRANAVAAALGVTAEFHLKFDLGMGRYGFRPEAVETVSGLLQSVPSLSLTGTYAHLNQAFGSLKKTRAQIEIFEALVDALCEFNINPGMVHLYNSSALFRLHDVVGDAARIGSALIGRIAKGGGKLRPVGYLETVVHEPHTLNAGATVGYGAACKLKRATQVAVLPVGYAHGFGVEKVRDTYRLKDGVRYLLQDLVRTLTRKRIFVTIGGKAAPTLGHIGMLHTVVDLSRAPCEEGDVAIVPLSPLYRSGSVPVVFID